MRLIWVRHPDPDMNGHLVAVGDKAFTSRNEPCVVDYFRPPHKPSSEGKVSVRFIDSNGVVSGSSSEFYASVIGAAWIEREDQE